MAAFAVSGSLFAARRSLSGTKRLPCFNILSVIALRTPKRSLTSLLSDKITVNGINLHYEKAGKGSQVLLCLPGALGSTQSDFGPQLTGLSDRFTVIAYDPRGYGKSRPPQRDFPIDFYERDAWDASELMRKLGYTQYSLLGWSDGGASAMILAAKNATVIEKMVILAAQAMITHEDLDLCEKTRDIDKWHPRMREPLEALYGADGLRSMWEGWLDAFDAIYKKGGNICQQLLPKIKCPTLIVNGSKDPLVAPIHPGHLHENIKGSELYIWPDGRHNLHLRYPDEFNDMVSKFLKK